MLVGTFTKTLLRQNNSKNIKFTTDLAEIFKNNDFYERNFSFNHDRPTTNLAFGTESFK
jgi:hypothetical protein